MKKQYSKWALKALKLAEETARKCSHNYIGTEHILAGLLAVKDSTAGEILTEAGISLKKLLELMEKLVAPSSEVLLEEPQGYTPRSKKVLEKASEEATNTVSYTHLYRMAMVFGVSVEELCCLKENKELEDKEYEDL